MAPDSTTKVVRTKTFKNLPGKLRSLSLAELDIFLSGVINDIKHAQQALLVETNRKKYISINANLPRPQGHLLSNDQLQNLVGNLPSLDTI